jgi:hypothetical protein|nr:MAG TPA: hypothetical protein [Caudoviricetes sp.]
MNIAEYIEQKMDGTSSRTTVSYPKFAKEVGLKDIHAAKEWIKSDLQDLFNCRFIKHNANSSLQSCLIEELYFTKNHVQIDFSCWTHGLRNESDTWLSDILKQTHMNNYIVRGE